MSEDKDQIAFQNTVDKVTKNFGTRGFTAKKTAAADILGEDIKNVRGQEGAETVVVSSVLDNLETAQRDLESSRDPQSTKEILKTVKDLKQVVKNLRQSEKDPLDEETADKLDELLDKTDKNVKRAAKGGGAFGKANTTFLESLTETLNPLSALGNFFGAAGITPLEGYFNSLGDSLNDKIKSALGIGASEESMNLTRDIQKQQQAEIATADQEQAVVDQSVLTKDGSTSTKGSEEGGGLVAEDLLMPSTATIPLTKRRLAHALGLTDANGKSYLGMLVDFMKPDPASRGEGTGGPPGAELLGIEGGGDEDAEIPKPKGILARVAGFVAGAFGIIFGGLGKLITAPFRLVGGLIKKLGGSIIARIGLRGALAGTLAGIPIVGWVAALVIQAAFGIFDGIKNFLTVSKDPSATIGDKIFGFFDGLISGFFTFGLVKPEKIKEFRGKIASGFGNLMDGLESGLGSAIDVGVNTAKGMADAFKKDILAPISNAGKAVKDASTEFLKSTLRSILPKGDGGKFSPGRIVKMAIPESVYKFAGLDKETGEMIPDPVPARAELTGDMRTAMSDMSGVQTGGSSVSMATQNNLNTSNTTNNTIGNASPQDKDFDYYAFRGPMVHA